MGERYERFADIANGRDDAPAGDALRAARKRVEDVAAAYISTEPYMVNQLGRALDALIAAARAEGAAEERQYKSLVHVRHAILNWGGGPPESIEQWEALAVHIARFVDDRLTLPLRSPSSGTEAP